MRQRFSSTCNLFIYQAPSPASLSSDPPPPPLGHLPTVLSLGLALQHPSSPRQPASSHCTSAAGQGSDGEGLGAQALLYPGGPGVGRSGLEQAGLLQQASGGTAESSTARARDLGHKEGGTLNQSWCQRQP